MFVIHFGFILLCQSNILQKTHGFSYRDLRILLRRAAVVDLVKDRVPISSSSLEEALKDVIPQQFRDLSLILDSNVHMSDVAG